MAIEMKSNFFILLSFVGSLQNYKEIIELALANLLCLLNSP